MQLVFSRVLSEKVFPLGLHILRPPLTTAEKIPDSAYQPKRDFFWLLARPWILLPRLIEILIAISSIAFQVFQSGKSADSIIQDKVGKSILRTLTNLGPCFIKVGQALSTRPDLVKKEWLEELINLQDNLPPFEHKLALDILKIELGDDPHELFEYFPDRPIAAASLGQVYKARLEGEYYVAVKIQRPELLFIIRRDLVIIRFLSILASPFLPLNLGFGIADIIDEFGITLYKEIDYLQEADNAEQFYSLFANNSSVTIPRVERLLSTKKVITTSWIDGVKLRDAAELISNNLDPTALIRTGVTSGIQQLLEFGFFHADPHPGNLFAIDGKSGNLGHIAYVDFGMMDKITDSDRLILTGAVVHLINNDYALLAEDFKDLGFLTNNYNSEDIIPALKEALGGHLGDSVSSFNFKSITDKFSELMFDYPFRVPARFALIIRAIVSQEGLALSLDPNFKIVAVAYPYVTKKLLLLENSEMVDILTDVIFDSSGKLRIERLENMFDVLFEEGDSPDLELIPLAGAGIRLLLSKKGFPLRSKLLMTLIKDERLTTDDIESLIILLQRKFNFSTITTSVIKALNLNLAR